MLKDKTLCIQRAQCTCLAADAHQNKGPGFGSRTHLLQMQCNKSSYLRILRTCQVLFWFTVGGKPEPLRHSMLAWPANHAVAVV